MDVKDCDIFKDAKDIRKIFAEVAYQEMQRLDQAIASEIDDFCFDELELRKITLASEKDPYFFGSVTIDWSYVETWSPEGEVVRRAESFQDFEKALNACGVDVVRLDVDRNKKTDGIEIRIYVCANPGFIKQAYNDKIKAQKCAIL